MHSTVCYSSLWYVSVYYNALRCILVSNNVLQFMKVYCSILQCITDVENVLQFTKALYYSI